MPVATLVGTPDPDEDLRQRVANLEQTLAGELQRLIRSLQQTPGSATHLQDLDARVVTLEQALSDFTAVLLDVRDQFQGHVHHAAPQTTGGVV